MGAPHPPPRTTPFVGREATTALLAQLLEEPGTGRLRVAMLVGEPGIGKTRLAREFVADAERRGAQVLWGRCFESESPRPFGPWVEALRALPRTLDARQLAERIGPNAGFLHQLLPGQLGQPPAQVAAEGRAELLYESVAALLRVAADERPLVLVLDDLHWADGDSLQLLRYVTWGGASCLACSSAPIARRICPPGIRSARS